MRSRFNPRLGAIALVLSVMAVWLDPSGLPRAFASQDAPAGTLPRTVVPIVYRLDLAVDPARSGFTGHVEIDVRFEKALKQLYLDASNLRVTSARVRENGRVYKARYETTSVEGVARLSLPESLLAGRATLIFDYTGDVRAVAEGLFHAKVGNDWFAWTMFEFSYARSMFPCFDDPRFKTPFIVTVTSPPADRVFSNSDELASTVMGDAVVHRFAMTEPLPTYLVSIAVGPFVTYDTIVPASPVREHSLRLRMITYPGHEAAAKLVLKEAVRLLQAEERHLGVPYPFPKLDFVTAPGFSGGEENAGLILFGEPAVFMPPGSGPQVLRRSAIVVAHEIAHHWFGDAVTPRWWNDLWLSESFATWFSTKIVDGTIRSPLGATETMAATSRAMAEDSLTGINAMRQPIATTREAAELVDAIPYDKGAQVLRMFEQYAGPGNFERGLQQYIEQNRYGAADPSALYRSLVSTSGKRLLGPAMRTFIDQSGVPVVSIREEGGKIQLRQSRYAPLGDNGAKSPLWMIPVCLVRLDAGREGRCVLLKTRSMTIADLGGHGVLFPNAGATGYYRFSLTDSAWKQLIGRSSALSGPEALALSDSLWADFAAGRATFATVLAAARELSHSPNAIVATGLGLHLADLARTMLSSSEQAEYQAMMRSIYAPRLSVLGLRVGAGAEGEDVGQRHDLREALLPLLAFEGRDRQIRAALTAAAEKYVGGDKNAVQPWLLGTALSVAVQDQGQPFLERLEALYMKTSDGEVRAAIITALGKANTPALAQAALRFAQKAGLSQGTLGGLLTALDGQMATRTVATRFAMYDFDSLVHATPGFERARLVNLFGGYCGRAAGKEAMAFLRPRLPDLPGGQQALTMLGAQIAECDALRRARGGEIAGALRKFAPALGPGAGVSGSRDADSPGLQRRRLALEQRGHVPLGSDNVRLRAVHPRV